MAEALERPALGILAHPSPTWNGLLRDIATERSLEEDLIISRPTIAPRQEVERRMVDVLPQVAHQIRNALSPIPYSLALLEARPGNLELEHHVATTISSQVEQIARLLEALEDGEQFVPASASPVIVQTKVPECDRRWSLRIAIDMPLNAAVSPSPASPPRSRAR